MTVDRITTLFPDKNAAVQALLKGPLAMVAYNYFPGITFDPDYLYDKIIAAESDISHILGVRFVPTKFFPLPPTDAQLATIPDTMPYEVDPGYDYTPDMFMRDQWGFVVLRNKPIISVDAINFAYPSAQSSFSIIPLDWVRYDAKYAQIQLVPASANAFIAMDTFVTTVLTGSRRVPFMIQYTYQAGLTNAAKQYPELIDVIKKKAIVKILEDSMLPSSGSISADGLSQTMAINMDNFHDAVDRILYGPPGTNGGLMVRLNGIRMGVA